MGGNAINLGANVYRLNDHEEGNAVYTVGHPRDDDCKPVGVVSLEDHE